MKTHTHNAYNIHTTASKINLHGGVAHLTSDFASHKVITSGADPSGLGRWVWSTLQGRAGIVVRIVTAYRPVPDPTNQAFSVTTQHQKYFYENDIAGLPRQVLLDDLGNAITTWKSQGEQIILMMDLNENAWDSPTARTISRWGLRNAHTSHHPHLPPVATCNANTTDTPIDGIWITPGLEIRAAGMEGFSGTLATTDHRLLWVDIDLDSLFGFRPPPLQPIQHVGIPMNDPKWGDQFNNRLKKERIKLNIPNQIFFLEDRARRGEFDHDDGYLFDQLITQDDTLRANLKQQLRKKFAGKVPFSDTMGHTRMLMQLYHMLLLRRQHRRVDRHKIRRLMNSTQITDGFLLSVEQLKQRQADTRKLYFSQKKYAGTLRDEFAQRVNERRARKYNTTVKVQAQITKNAFKQKAPYARIRRILETKLKTSLRTVVHTNEEVDTECITKDAIESACMQEGQARYSQTHGTPFLSDPLISEIGMLGNQTTVNAILNGTFDVPEELDQFTKEFIHELQQPAQIPELSTVNGVCTTAEHCIGWKKMKARTSASTFGPSFSEYIIGSDCTEVAEVDAAIASIPAMTGHCPRPWSQAIDVMIPKKTSSNHVKKLRIIVLFHALFNMLNKRVAKRLVRHAEDSHTIPSEAYGSRHDFRSNDCGLNKTLSNDISRQQKWPYALCSNDAKSCYDRIVHSVANICMQRLGATPETCRAMFGTLQQLEHHVRTAYGTSASSYGSIGIPLQGVLQGNGAGPAIWLVVSIPLINMLRTKGLGFRSINTITGESYRFVCYTFVDDTDLIHNNMDQSTLPEVISGMQEMLNTWSGGLNATGGQLVPAKSYWYAIDFTWNTRKLEWEYTTIDDSPGTLVLQHPDGTRHELERLAAHEARETLGIWIAPDGNQDAQLLALHDKIESWADKIRTKQLSKSDAWLSLRMGIAKSLRYPLTATNLSKAECTLLDEELLDVALPALGIPRRYPKKLIHGSKKALGLGVPRLWDHQGIDHLNAMLRHGDASRNDITHCLFTDVLATMQAELGLPGSPFEHSFKQFRLCTTQTHAYTTWEFCNDYDLILRIGTELKLLREHDVFLMLVFAAAGYTPLQLKKINLCRQWAKVITLANITTGDGRYLQPGVLNPPFHCKHPASIKWPKVGTPTKDCWNLWVEAITKCFLYSDDRYTHKRLRSPLGRWYQAQPNWPWFATPTQDALFVFNRAKLQWQSYTPKLERTQRSWPTFQPTQTYLDALPQGVLPTTVSGRYCLQTGGCAAIAGTPTPSEEHASLSQHWWRDPWHTSSNIEALCQGIEAGTAVCVTDGSYKDSTGTAAFVILPALDSTDSWVFTNHTPGDHTTMDAYRAELGGIYGCVAFINLFCQEQELTGHVTMACDCDSALTNIFRTTNDKPSQPHFDMVHQLRYMVANSSVAWTPRHVKAHQDDHLHYDALDQWAKLNVDMDSLAKYHWQVVTQEQRPTISLPHAYTWSLWHKDCRVTTWAEDIALQLIYTCPSQQVWRNYHHISASTQVEWKPLYRAYGWLPDYKKLWLSRWLTNWAPIGKNLKRWKIQPTDSCPRCGLPETDRHHVIRCQQDQARQLWDTSLDKLEQWLKDHHTEPQLRAYLLQALKSWNSSTIIPPPTDGTNAVLDLVLHQDRMGWDRLFDGFMVQGWVSTQQTYLQSVGKKTTGEKWASRLIIRLWEIAWDMWRHRQKIARTLDSQALLELHEDLDAKIRVEYIAYHQSLRPILQRWFSRTYENLTAESADFKQQWLAIVAAANACSLE